ncbi:MAG: hypothetical protein C4520_21950 [Candidatus Abyssobacteria bacterium SURF_5]|uniref:Uncharacterized protein n=1 Tax=Abyssobacteria bacterium (strain SURF_5) TaxID=2093360 RepID=A0A3A4MV95_ABYX5|nr:MAG: hypothetical protein C4520_21950 [Candidatus Abyssubacteria bacterium SURF_5]
MGTVGKRLKRNIARNQLLDRELDYLPATIDRDEVREMARRYGPLRRRSLAGRLFSGASGFVLRYGAPFIGLIAGAEYQAAKALYPLIGEEQRLGDSLRIVLGEDLSKRVDDANTAFKVTGALVGATPDIMWGALYGAFLGIVAYYVLRWTVLLGSNVRRRRKLNKKISELMG